MSILYVKSKKKRCNLKLLHEKIFKKNTKKFFLSGDHMEMFISANFEIFVTVKDMIKVLYLRHDR